MKDYPIVGILMEKGTGNWELKKKGVKVDEKEGLRLRNLKFTKLSK